jgi:hypothetical protein
LQHLCAQRLADPTGALPGQSRAAIPLRGGTSATSLNDPVFPEPRTPMADADPRTVALLEELVALQKTANAQQREALQKTDRYYDEARQRTERAIELQQTAVARQRWVVRVWIGMLVFIVACVAGLLWSLSRYLH